MRHFWLEITIVGGALIAGCTATAPPTLSPSNSDNAIQTIIEPMQINKVDVVGLEIQPPAPGAVVDGIVGNSCSELESVSQFRDGNTVSIQINIARTVGPTVACAELAQLYSDTLPLEGDFPPGDYMLIVNGTAVAFTIAGGPACTFNSDVLADITLPPGSEVASGEPFIKTWRLRNTGSCAWDSTFHLVQTEGDLLQASVGSEQVSLPTTPPGAEAEISVELTLSAEASTASQHAARFQLRTPTGELFGAQPLVQVIVAEEAVEINEENCIPDSEFLTDITIPDGSPVVVGQPFVKTWRIRNTGTCTWNANYHLVHIRGDVMLPQEDDLSLPVTPPGEIIELSMTLLMPADTPIGSRQETRFQIRNPDGLFFGIEPFVLATAAAAS